MPLKNGGLGFIIDLHAKKEKLIAQRSHADVSFLLLHAYRPMLEGKQSHASRSRKTQILSQITGICRMKCTQKEKVPFSPEGSLRTHYLCSGPANPRNEVLAFYSLRSKQKFLESLCQD